MHILILLWDTVSFSFIRTCVRCFGDAKNTAKIWKAVWSVISMCSQLNWLPDLKAGRYLYSDQIYKFLNLKVSNTMCFIRSYLYFHRISFLTVGCSGVWSAISEPRCYGKDAQVSWHFWSQSQLVAPFNHGYRDWGKQRLWKNSHHCTVKHTACNFPIIIPSSTVLS